MTTWCPETRQVVGIHVSQERLLDLHEILAHYLLSLEERLGVHLSAIDSDHDQRKCDDRVTTA
jgi:hypothetical protein